MVSGLFLTGTDTGVGKSAAAAFIAVTARAAGLTPLYWKPVQCGPGEWNGTPEPGGDAATVTALVDEQLAAFTSLTYRTPSSPLRASVLEKRSVDVDGLLCDWGLLEEGALPEGVGKKRFNWVLAEGAGGLLVPLTESFDMADLAAATTGRAIVVAKPGLGTVNSTRLAVEVARSRGIEVVGFLFSPPSSGDNLELVEDNWRTIERLAALPFFGFVPRLERGREIFVERRHPLFRWLEQERERLLNGDD